MNTSKAGRVWLDMAWMARTNAPIRLRSNKARADRAYPKEAKTVTITSKVDVVGGWEGRGTGVSGVELTGFAFLVLG
jgi:hypothetical protein